MCAAIRSNGERLQYPKSKANVEVESGSLFGRTQFLHEATG
jgi:hypothetical protein